MDNKFVGQNIVLKYMMTHVDRITPIVKLNSKLKFPAYVIIVMHIYLHIYLLKELYQSQTMQPQLQPQVIKRKN